MPQFRKILFVFDFAVSRNNRDIERNVFAACVKCLLDSRLNSAAAGHLHAYYGNTLDVINCQNSCQLFGIVHAVKLRTSDERNFILDEIIVEIAVSESRAVGGDEQVGTVKIGSIDGNKLYLNGPLRQTAFDFYASRDRA